MKTKIIEATSPAGNFGKFLLGQLEPRELRRPFYTLGGQEYVSRVWGAGHIFVLDLATGEGAMFLHGGLASADLDKHRVWVCPLFEPFLEWLYTKDISAGIEALPELVSLVAPLALAGYRRPGPVDWSNRIVGTPCTCPPRPMPFDPECPIHRSARSTRGRR